MSVHEDGYAIVGGSVLKYREELLEKHGVVFDHFIAVFNHRGYGSKNVYCTAVYCWCDDDDVIFEDDWDEDMYDIQVKRILALDDIEYLVEANEALIKENESLIKENESLIKENGTLKCKITTISNRIREYTETTLKYCDLNY